MLCVVSEGGGFLAAIPRGEEINDDDPLLPDTTPS